MDGLKLRRSETYFAPTFESKNLYIIVAEHRIEQKVNK